MTRADGMERTRQKGCIEAVNLYADLYKLKNNNRMTWEANQILREIYSKVEEMMAVQNTSGRGQVEKAREEMAKAGIVAEGYKGDSEEGEEWVLFEPDVTDEMALSHFSKEYYNGVGQPFGMEPCLTRTKTRVLVTQSVGLDI